MTGLLILLSYLVGNGAEEALRDGQHEVGLFLAAWSIITLIGALARSAL